jgi:hypothetical protein
VAGKKILGKGNGQKVCSQESYKSIVKDPVNAIEPALFSEVFVFAVCAESRIEKILHFPLREFQ